MDLHNDLPLPAWQSIPVELEGAVPTNYRCAVLRTAAYWNDYGPILEHSQLA